MMKIMILLLALLLSVSPALADAGAGEGVYFEVPLCPQSIAAWEDEALLLAGSSTGSTPRRAEMMALDASGQLLWQYAETNLPDLAEYAAACRQSDGTVVALLSTLTETYLDFIDEDARVRRIGPFSQAELRCISPSGEGVLISGNPETGCAMRLMQMDGEGKILWSLDFGEYLVFEDMVRVGDINYMFGCEIYGANEAFAAVTMAVREDGTLLWKYSNPEDARYTDGTFLEDGRMLVAGVVGVDEDASSLSCYGDGGMLWRTQLSDATATVGGVQVSVGKACAVAPRGENILLACTGICDPIDGAGSGAWLFLIDRQGNVLEERCVQTDRIRMQEGCALLEFDDSLLLAVYGTTDSLLDYDWGEPGTPSVSEFTRGFHLMNVDELFQ